MNVTDITRYPTLVFVLSFVVLWLSAWIGASFFRKYRELEESAREDFGVIVAATLTLLALIIGFSFSMAISRYDQRKNLEEEEANAIGTEYVRAELLPAADAAKVRALLKIYLEDRIAFYTASIYTMQDVEQRRRIDARTGQSQADLWATIRTPAMAQPTPVMALVVSGMNDVLNSQGYTQAAWWNRIPVAAWALMLVIAVFCNLMVGYGAHKVRSSGMLLVILPAVVA